MSKKTTRASACAHKELQLDPSRYAEEVYGYVQPSPEARMAATRSSDKSATSASAPLNTTFPGPLVLPEDELAWSPQYETQALQPWMDGKWRNATTDQRKTLYVVPPPGAEKRTQHILDSLKPKLDAEAAESEQAIEPPSVNDVADYLCAFYHGLPVKQLQTPKLRFVPWAKPTRAREPNRIGLHIGSEITGIRIRPSKDGVFDYQLNLLDLLDAAMRMLPKDAYALIMLVHHDLYEDDDDDFCCGRAFGGSRVSVISTARYNPAFDRELDVEREHAWPASHCATYVEKCCYDADVAAGVEPSRKKVKTTKTKGLRPSKDAMDSAIREFGRLTAPTTAEELATLWLGRACKTASHELGHCFGMDHCVYYACVMQGTTGLSEDARQPPYLCPVDLAKVLYATGAQEVDRYRAMLQFCQRWEGDRMFAAFAAWLQIRIEQSELTTSPAVK